MAFCNWDGHNESQNFADYYHYLHFAQKTEIKCPKCGYIMKTTIYPSFDMIKHGKAEHTCTNEDCHFSKNKIIIEAIGGKPHGLDEFHKRQYPSNY